MKQLKIIAVTHRKAALEEIGRFHIEDTELQDRLMNLKKATGVYELVYLSTCNRVEFIIAGDTELNDAFLQNFFEAFNPEWGANIVSWATKASECFVGTDAVQHLFGVASSTDSMVVGEREIITQVRNAYENSEKMGLTGDFLRILMQKTIQVAKEVYSQTAIATKPVSVVSLAYRKLIDLNVKLDARFLIIGAGKTSANMTRFLKKHGYTNFVVFNRTIANGEKLAEQLDGRAYSLAALETFDEGFDVIITCTGSAEPVITQSIYQQLQKGETGNKIAIDLAIPSDVAIEVCKEKNLHVVGVESLKSIAAKNLLEREGELESCREIIVRNREEFEDEYHERKVEIAMRTVPQAVKEITDAAVNTVFAKELSNLDSSSKEVLERVIQYMEKKYISGPMKLAKEIILEQQRGS